MTDAEATTADATRVHGDRAERLRGAPSPALMLTGRRDHFGRQLSGAGSPQCRIPRPVSSHH